MGGERRIVGAVGCLVAVVALGWAAAAAGSGGDRSGDGSASGRRDATTTTLPLVPVTGGAPLPPTSTTPPSVPLPSPQQVAAAIPPTSAPGGPPPPRALSGEGALLVAPATDGTRPVDKAKGCRSANDPGWRNDDCGALRRDDAVLLWVVQSRGKAARVLVLRERTAGQWAPVLVATNDDGSRWHRVGVRADDVSGDGRPDLVFGFHTRSPDKAVAVDVVDTPGAVGLHRLLPGGAARLERGALHGWSRLGDGSYEHDTFKWIAGAWRVAASERVQAGAVPPSMI